jgi:hypothetical protein
VSKIVTFTAGMRPTAAQMDSLVPIYARKTSDETIISSSTLQNDDDLAWPVAASAVYEFELHMLASSGTTPDLKTGFTFPTGMTGALYGIGPDASGTPPAVTFDAGALSAVLNWNGTGGNSHYMLWGILTVAPTAGTLQLQWAQGTLTASNTIMRAGSYGKLTRIA